MTRKEIVDAAIGSRFGGGRRGVLNGFLNEIYARVWNEDVEWEFVMVAPTALTVDAQAVDLPEDASDEIDVYDANGQDLEYLTPRDFFSAFQGDTSSGMPSHFTVVYRKLYFGPTPDASYPFSSSYRRRLVHLDGSGNTVKGVMSAEDDQPFWNEDHHSFLSAGTAALGLLDENDPTWLEQDARFQQGLAAMKRDLGVTVGSPIQFGRSPLE